MIPVGHGKAFTSAGFTSHLSQFEQAMKFAGVVAHHHNGNAERAIQTIMYIVRTMMLHSAIHWPDVADPIFAQPCGGRFDRTIAKRRLHSHSMAATQAP